MKTKNYGHGTPSVDDTAAYLAGCDEVFRAVRLSDGQPLFTLPIGAYTAPRCIRRRASPITGCDGVADDCERPFERRSLSLSLRIVPRDPFPLGRLRT